MPSTPHADATKVRTTGQLRDLLASLLLGIKNGTVDVERARTITKMAAQINESFYSEIKHAKVQHEAGKQMSALGSLPIGSE